MDPQMMAALMQMVHGQANGGAQFLGGLFGDSGKPYAEGQRAMDRFTSPWSNAGRNAINPFSQRVNQMGDTNGFYNGIMNNYKESPFARYQQQQGVRAAQNLGSATGLTGSTPLMQQAQQNAQNISSQDQQRFFENQRGINQDYLSGQNQLLSYGNNADINSAPFQAEAAYGKEAGNQQDTSNIFGGLMHLLMG